MRFTSSAQEPTTTSTTGERYVGNFAPHNGTGLMVTYSSMPGKKMLNPVVVAGSPELGPVTGRHCSNVEKGVAVTTVERLEA
jgi:hypothetical protein